ncbi:PEP/pyruvate-binding domain-containing protein [Desulfovibrio inopinatus]|uniref:PEP/pyruvate-binding domain-containing protein n=1 Tax=Desulfovibrio inopinatus TaxID=102109 RepID=UPI00040E1B6A|nr:PEP/pyruvate-binding domain-containing protein [Desulfovibrio inopinatus]
MGWFDRLFGRSAAKRENRIRDIASLREEFRRRYELFLSIIRANNQALEVMSELDAGLRGERLFGMAFVRSRSLTAVESARTMAMGLMDLAPQKYDALADRLAKMRENIEPCLRLRTSERAGPFVLDFSKADRERADLVGGKMASLAELASVMRVAVPEGFVITSAGFMHFLKMTGLQERIQEGLSSLASADDMDDLHRLSQHLQQMVIAAEVPDDLAEAIYAAYDDLAQRHERQLHLAMRSSAVGEDFASISFAGQYRTELNVSRESLLTAYKEVVASKYGLTAMSYRLARGIADEETPMCVGCLRMINAIRGGVMYTRNPMPGGEEELLLSAVFGLPKAVVDGSAPSDLYAMRRGGAPLILRSVVAEKTFRFECGPVEGVRKVSLPESQHRASVLSVSQAMALAELGLAIEAFYNRPMDVEWAFDAIDNLVLLQCRPLTIAEPSLEIQDDVTVGGGALVSGGVTASRGVAVGNIHKVFKEADMLSFPKGAVLVARQSSPRLAPLLSRAVAVVAEQGSVTGHLANVAREFGVPALFGLTGALEILPDAGVVTVDADNKAIFGGTVPTLLTRRPRPRNLMEGSTVLATLKDVSRHIAPLTLIDPDSPAFRASNCETVHDVTRFCHEKAVHELFRFGKHHENPEFSGKRLVTSVTMQWWVLDLSDGIAKEMPGKYVHLDNIVSIPMRALWDGIIAVPWQGPPAIDGRGFMSVLFNSTMNRSLDPAMPSHYSSRNYFMISKNFCSLHSRFGYHFAQVESMVSEHARENYASFRFQGGAADDMRRERRVAMVGELLELHGFRVDLREDRLAARLERLSRSDMECGLRVLGYLLMHTRQLDMIMNNAEQVALVRARLQREMDQVSAMRCRWTGVPEQETAEVHDSSLV